MTARLIEFPKARKRGPKVRTGPCAEVLAFPLRTQKGELWKRWLWLKQRGADWTVEDVGDLDEVVPASVKDGEQARLMGAVLGERARREVPDLEARLRKRSSVKNWLEGLGADSRCVQSAEDALFFAFDRFGGPTPPNA